MILPSASEGSYLHTGKREWEWALVKESSFSYSFVRPVVWKSRALTKGHHLLFLSFEQPVSAADGLFPALIPILTPLPCGMECSANSKRRNEGGGRACLYEHQPFREGEIEKMASWISLFPGIPVISLVSPVSLVPSHWLSPPLVLSLNTHTHTHRDPHAFSLSQSLWRNVFLREQNSALVGMVQD